VDDSVGKFSFPPPNQVRAGPPSVFAEPIKSVFFDYLFPTIEIVSVAFHNQKKKKATAMGLRKFGNFPRGFLPAPPPITPVLLAI
jgi:hypothetical protein